MNLKNVTFIRLNPCLPFNTSHPQNNTPPVDIGYCASILDKNGYRTSFIDILELLKIKKLSIFINSVKRLKPDIVIIHTTTTTAKLAIDLAMKIKSELNIPIFSMGQHPTAMPETFLYNGSPIDVCIIGEADITTLELVKTFQKNGKIESLDGIAFFNNQKNMVVRTHKRELVQELDTLPFPKHDFFINGGYYVYYPIKTMEKIKTGFILSSRGCPYKCLFCSPTLRVSYGAEYRSRSPKNVVDEIEYLASRYGVNTIYFIDDDFTLDRKRVHGICDEILERKLDVKWAIQSRVSDIDKNLVRKMKKANCSTFCFGVESGSSRILKLLRKEVTKDQIRKAFKIVKNMGLLTVGFFMIGCPTETYEEIEETFQFCKELQPDLIQLAFFTPYPGSPAFEEIGEKIDFERYSHYNDIAFNFSEVSEEKLRELQKKFYKNYYLSTGFMWRYLKSRFSYILKNFNREINLIKSAFRFLYK